LSCHRNAGHSGNWWIWVLARSEGTSQRFYSISSQIRRERNAYYGCLGRAFAGAETTLAGVLHKAGFWERHHAAALNERQRKIVNMLLDGFDGKLTSSKWAKIAKTSQATAGRDIGELERPGILKKQPAGGRSTSYLLATAATGESRICPNH
jgi:Fic family protein